MISAQKINGKRFLKLETIDFSHLGISYGVGMDLKGLAETINDDLLSKGTLRDSVNDNIPSDSPGANKQRDSMSEMLPEIDDKFAEIEQYFTVEEFNEMSDYDKDVHLNLKRKYDSMCEKAPSWNVESVAMPEFMKPKKLKTITTKTSRSLAELMASSSTQSSPGTSSDGSRSGPIILRTQKDPSAGFSFSRFSTGPDPSFARVLRPQLNTTTTVDESEEDICDDDQVDQGIDQIEKPKAKPLKMAEIDYIPTLPSFDIDDIISKLKGNKQMRGLQDELNKDGPLSSVNLKLLVRTLVLKLFCDKEGNYKRDTTAQQKEGLAASLILRCPFLKDDSDPTKWTWWRVYDRKMNRGRIPNVISHLQRKQDDEDKPPRNVVPSTSGSGDTAQGENAGSSSSAQSIDDFSWLGLLVPSAGEHKQILLGMNQSFPARKSWILSDGPTIHDVLEKFPHLVSYNGELIEEEFKLLYPKINHLALLQSFPPFISKLKSQETLPSLPENLSDDVLQGCLWLAEKMPWQNLKRFGKGKRGKLDLQDLVHIIPSGVNVREAIEERRRTSQGPVQPYLICLIPDRSISKMFAVVDNKTVEIKTSSFVKGLDIIFKIYHVFNVNYPAGWSRFLCFLEWGFYKIDPQKLTNSMKDLITKIES
ncbi:uncharacterized protein LOC117653748 isoform X2 [Thrips palmi]|uniref:Uncharacterized protein LOC117653748 isoform X2 n=1 Tax=Thrips palmi TaxID=161013 RepID=A0A6P9ADS4_THRPL|nr:uncharacterized protein LOC117653748 isoform X2 [Thrips palmi]